MSSREHAIFRNTRELLFLFLLPPIAWIVLRISLLNQAGYLDPYFYTGYIHNSGDLLGRFGLPYYSTRFGLIMPNWVFTWAFGTAPGYLALRYVLTLLAGIPLYVLIKRGVGIHAAVLTYCALVTSPFFNRALFWDHPDSTGVPYILAAICLIALELRPVRVWDIAIGCLFGLAINSNIFTVTVLGLFVLAYAGASLIYRRSISALITRLAYILSGAILVSLCGVLYYYYAIGHWNIFLASLGMAYSLAKGGMQAYRSPGYVWFTASPHLLILPLICIYCLIGLRSARRSFISTVAFAYAAMVFLFYYVYDLVFHADILQLFYYFSYSLPAVFLTIPIIFSGLWADLPKNRLPWVASLGIAGFVLPWFLRAHGFDIPHLPFWQFVSFALATAVVLAAAIYARGANSAKVALIGAATILIGLTFFEASSADIYWEMIQSNPMKSTREWNVYKVAMQFMDAAPKVKDKPGALNFWYKAHADLDSIQSTYLWAFTTAQQSPPADPGMPFIGAYQRRIFGSKQSKYLVLLGTSEVELQQGLQALRKEGFPFELLDHKILKSGTYEVYWQLIEFLHT